MKLCSLFLSALLTWGNFFPYSFAGDLALLKEFIQHELFHSRQNSDSDSMGVVKTPPKLLLIGAAEMLSVIVL